MCEDEHYDEQYELSFHDDGDDFDATWEAFHAGILATRSDWDICATAAWACEPMPTPRSPEGGASKNRYRWERSEAGYRYGQECLERLKLCVPSEKYG